MPTASTPKKILCLLCVKIIRSNIAESGKAFYKNLTASSTKDLRNVRKAIHKVNHIQLCELNKANYERTKKNTLRALR